MDNKKLLLCILSAVIITTFCTPLNSLAQNRNSFQGPGQQESHHAPNLSKQEEEQYQLQKKIILQGNSRGQQVLDQYLLEQQQLIIKQVTDQIVKNPTQADAIIRTAVRANLGMSDIIAAVAIKAAPEQAATIVQAATATCIPGQAYAAVVYSAILAGADPAVTTNAARNGGATSAQIKEGETRALQQLQLQQKKDPDTTAAKTK